MGEGAAGVPSTEGTRQNAKQSGNSYQEMLFVHYRISLPFTIFQELELERKRYNESAEALTRNQEDLRKREVKITSLEKENETMKKKIADLEEDLRVRTFFVFKSLCCVCHGMYC